MKKTLLLVAVVLGAMNTNAQTEVLDVASDEIQAKIAEAIANPIDNNNPNFIEVPRGENDENVFPEGTYPDNTDIVTGGTKITMKDYVWEASTTSINLKAVSTPNLDAAANESWQVVSNNDNMKLNVEGCSPMFTMAMKGKNGNPSLAYKDFYDYNSDGEAVHRVSETLWTLGCGELPVKGLYYKFTAKSAGTLKIGVYIHRISNVGTFVVEEETKTPLPVSALKLEGFMNNNTWDGFEGKVWHEFVFDENYQIQAEGQNRAVFGYLTFDVEEGKSYYVFNDRQQMGLYGFEFTPSGGDTPGGDDSAISNITTNTEDPNAPVYNLAGQRVGKETKGLLIQNGKKFIRK